MTFILAFIPIGLILVLMLGLRWGAARAGGAGYLSGLLISILFFGADPVLLAYSHVKALFLSLDVLLIIWGAFLLYMVADEAGAIRTIGKSLPHLTADKGMQALVIGWVFASFLQGVGGFGVPVAVIAPILVGLGFTPLTAVIIPSIGHGWGVTFGSLGSSFQALISATSLPASELSPHSALFLSLAGLVTGLMVAHAASGWEAVRRLVKPVLVLGVVMGIVHFIVAVAGFWNLATFIAAVVGLLLCFPLARSNRTRQLLGSPDNDNDPLDPRALILALSGYAILVVIILSVQFITPLKEFLGQVYFRVTFPEMVTDLQFVTPASSRSLHFFNHTGTQLFYASLFSYFVYRTAGLYHKPRAAVQIIGGTVRKVMSSSVSIASMVSMAVIMENSGMTDTLAQGLATSMGQLFPAVAPWIGALGAFMTGSNTNSNVVFGALQLRTAYLLGYLPALILAAQTAGASLASVIAPTKVVVGASTAGMAGHEGEVMRKLLVYTLPLVFLISLFTLLGVWISSW
jgi:lactate permease